ncbi:hypothetical protein AB1A65_05940 [Muricauda sp. ANG21]|uniref:hypothetical protein n=1 Tax=Allomuricauda sp. ANG21 TaxID=3042468 RepID=UPI00345415FA
MKKTLPTVILSAILFFLQNLNLENCLNLEEKTLSCFLKEHFYSAKSLYSAIALFLFIIYNWVIGYLEGNKVKNNLNDFLDKFFEDNLERKKENHRLTVFQTKWGFQIFFGYIWHTLSRLGYYRNCKKIKYRTDKTPVPWGKYLVIHSRCGMPNENYKSTIFRLYKDEKKVNSFAEYAYHTGQIESEVLPNIYELNFQNICNLQEVSRTNKKKVDTYMKKSHLRTFDSFRMFGRRTPYIAAIPLFTKKRSMNYPSHIIMYDSISLDFKEIKKEMTALSNYIQIILINS